MALMANIATASCSRARRAASSASFSPGFYRALNSQTSTIDNCSSSNVTGRRKATGLILLLEEVAGASDSELPPGCYLVERLIAVRKNKGKNEYLVLWENYPKEEASWVSEEDVTSVTIRFFESPTPPYRLIADATSHFTAAIQRSLKTGINSNNRLDLKFRTDVFRFLFDGKGRTPPNGRGLFYDLDDFNKAYFKDKWYVAYDKLGDGCSIDFPIRLESKIRWSPKVFNLDATVRPRIYSEIVCATLVKIRC